MVAAGAVTSSQTREQLGAAAGAMLAAGVDAALRADVRAEDVVASLAGILLAATSREQADRMLDLLAAGLSGLNAARCGAVGRAPGTCLVLAAGRGGCSDRGRRPSTAGAHIEALPSRDAGAAPDASLPREHPAGLHGLP